MQLTQFIQPLRFASVVKHLCLLMRLFAAVLIPPLIVSLASREFLYSVIFALLGTIALIPGFFFEKNSARLDTKEALVVTALAYLLFSLLGGIAFLPVASFLDGFFEAMSGFTTTGLSTLKVGELPDSLLFFRVYAQWVGGVGIAALSVIALVGPGKTAFQLYTSEFGEDNLLENVRATGRIVLTTYFILSVLGYIVFVIAGMSFSDALFHVMATLSTGGYSIYGKSIGYYHPPVQAAVIVFMLLGAVSFPSYYLLRHHGWRRFSRDAQIILMVSLIFASFILFNGLLGWRLDTLLPDLFHATSALTTTGFTVGPYHAWTTGEKFTVIFLMIVGGSAGSTAGGLKLVRIIIIFKLIFWVLLRPLLPSEAKLPLKYAGRSVTEGELMHLLAFAAIYIFMIFLSALLLVIAGFDITDSVFESASALGTVGLSAGITSKDLSSWAKLLLIFNMWAGRLEIIPVLVVFYYRIWLPRRKKA